MVPITEQKSFSKPPETGSITTVLVVDDSRLQRRILASLLKKWGFAVVEAESGDQAIDICRSLNPDLVLSDWMMPGMNGLEFCRAFRERPSEAYGYFILLTSKSEKPEIAQGLDAGADDFLTKPVNSDELRARISAGERILTMQRELSDKNKVIGETLDRLQTAYDSIDRDLMQAKKIQQSLVPERSCGFGASRVSLLLKPCGHIGGDLVGMFSADNRHVGFYSIDVSGHGITSAMVTARLGGYLSSRYFDQNLGMRWVGCGVYQLREPAEVAALLNDRLVADTGTDEYFTMAYGTVELNTGKLKLVQAGHPHPLILRQNADAEFIGEGGVPIGLLPDIAYSQVETTLCPGDQLLLYTDGFTECRLKNGEMLETEGLRELISKCRRIGAGTEFLDELYLNLTGVMDARLGLEDDVSATLFEFSGP